MEPFPAPNDLVNRVFEAFEGLLSVDPGDAFVDAGDLAVGGDRLVDDVGEGEGQFALSGLHCCGGCVVCVFVLVC